MRAISLIFQNISEQIMIDWLIKSKQRVKFQGKYKFDLLLNTQFVDSSSTISITCFTDKSHRAAVPCSYNWFIIKNGLPHEIQEFKGCTFICDTSHIGYFIQAHVISNDTEFSGKAIVTFGPVELDVSLKTSILNALSTGLLTLPVYLLGSQQQQKEGTLQLYESQIKLQHSFSDLSYCFDYSIIEPQITPHSTEVSKVTISFNEKYESEMKTFANKLFNTQDLTVSKSRMFMSSHKSTSSTSTSPKMDIKFLTRSSRDTFLFAMKAFISKRELKNSAVIRKIESINFEKQEQFGVILELDSLKRDLIRYDRLYKQAMAEKKRLMDDFACLQKQLQMSRQCKPIAALSSDYSIRREDPSLLAKISQVQRENQQLNKRLKTISNQLDQVRVSKSPELRASHLSGRSDWQVDSLAGLLGELSNTKQFIDKELIEKLQSQKKTLEFKLQRSFEKIDILEKRLNKSTILPQPLTPTPSTINFTYQKRGTNNNTQSLQINENLKSQNEELRNMIDALKQQNRELIREKAEKSMHFKIESANKIESHLNKVREQNRTTDMILESRLQQEKSSKMLKEIDSLQTELGKKGIQLDLLKKKIQEGEISRSYFEDKCIKWQRKANELQTEMEIYRKNQDVLNRSQHMSLQMENYSEEQIRVLKQHNSFLVEENEKLVRACEKYMADAKQNNKLRQQIIQLKERLNRVITNPEVSTSFA